MVDVNQFKLIIEDDEGRRSVVPVELGEVSIGRLEGNTIRLKERNVSRHHARLLKEGPGIYAEDLDSYNGLWVNGDRIQGRHELHDGDLIRIGDFHLELRGEGLFPRREDTTQRTLLDSDTQPGYQSGGGQPDEPTLTGAKPVNPEPTQIIDQQGPPGGEESFAHTAIIRPSDEPPAERRAPPPNVLTGQRPKLICVSTQYAGREYEIIKSETIIGRTDDNDIGIDHRSVSRQHAKVIVMGRRFKIMDLESANGTMVNGEAYAQTDIKRGDLIELGHVKFRFVPPGETYTLTADELAAVHGGGRSPRAGRMFVLWAAAGLVLMALIIAGWMVFNGSPKPPADGDAPPLAPVPPGGHSGEVGPDADRIMALVRSNMQQHRWKTAQALVQGLLALDSTNEQALSAMRQIDMEVRAQHSYDAAQASAQQNQWSDAWNALQEVPKESTLFAQAMTMMNTVRPALVNERLSECRSAIKSEDWDEAEMELEEVEGLDSSRKEIGELRSTIEEGRKRRPSAAHAKGAAHPTKLSAPKLSKPQAPPPPPPLKLPAEDPKQLYNDGAKSLLSGQFQKAIDTFNRCVQADKNFGLCYRGLGIAYAKVGNGPKAARYYRLYLKVEPTAKDFADVQKILKLYDSQQ